VSLLVSLNQILNGPYEQLCVSDPGSDVGCFEGNEVIIVAFLAALKEVTVSPGNILGYLTGFHKMEIE